jgi:UDP-hydrolysing UDP-N-acetyl-D-glucosamine 2-epimerase
LSVDPGELPSGVGDPVCLDEPFVLVSQHPVTTEYDQAEAQMNTTLEAVREWGVPAIVLWPNADAGSDGVSRAIRKMREQERAQGMHFYKNLPTDVYVRLMARTKCLVGNSSSAIREGAFVGVPAVNVGTRQSGRQRGKNVIDVPHDREAILSALKQQNKNGRYESDPIYGDGRAGQRIADILATCRISIQKKLAY